EMDHAARAPGEVGELVNEETLAGARKPGEEHHPFAAQAAELLLEAAIGMDHETAAHVRSLARFTGHVPRRRRPGERARLKPLEPAWRSAALRLERLAPPLVVLLELAVGVDDGLELQHDLIEPGAGNGEVELVIAETRVDPVADAAEA